MPPSLFLFTRTGLFRRYNGAMARGWESKSVEDQIAEFSSGPSIHQTCTDSPADLKARSRRNDLLLSRKRVLQQLEQSSNERYSALLRRSLADLDAQIASLS